MAHGPDVRRETEGSETMHQGESQASADTNVRNEIERHDGADVPGEGNLSNFKRRGPLLTKPFPEARLSHPVIQG